MRVNVKVNSKSAQITPAPSKKIVSPQYIQWLLRHGGPAIGIADMRVIDYQG
jgi:hypothetical protein